MFGAQTPPLPTDLLERQLLPFLPVRSVLRLARCSKTCRAALSSDNGASIDELFWKERHRRRWKTSKASELTTVSTTSDNDGNAANDTQQQQVQGVPGIGKWHASYKRRHELDATVKKHLRSPRHGAPPSEDPAWKYLLVDGGLDIFDRLHTIASSASPSRHRRQDGGDEFVADLGTIGDFERDVAKSALVAINRIDVISRWRHLISSPSSSVHIEDGAKLLARFYVGTQRVVASFSGGRLDHLDDLIDSHLGHLSHHLCLRLLTQHEGMSKAEAMARYAVIDEDGDQMISLANCEDRHFSLRGILEEMQNIFRGAAGLRVGLRGNVEDYYSYENSLLDHVLSKGLGIPISLSVIYAAVVRRAVGVVLDPVGLPGHFVLATPSSDDNNVDGERLFIDAFRGGEILSLDDVQAIVASYQIPWDDSFLEAVPYKDVWTRMVRNLRACHEKNVTLELLNEDNQALRVLGRQHFAELLRQIPPDEMAHLRYQRAMSFSIGIFLSGVIEGSFDADSLILDLLTNSLPVSALHTRHTHSVFHRDMCSS